MSYLVVNSLHKSYSDCKALNDVSFHVEEDELLVVLGATGAGKTTLLRSLCGLEHIDSGDIQMSGNNLAGVSPADRDMALVFQNFSLYPDWSVKKNLLFPLKAPGRTLSDAAAEERIAWASSLLHIEHLLERKANRLSGGEMQRVAIGRAIVRQPKLFLMDEPLTNLDAKLRESLRLELINMRRHLGAPMIYVTHDQAEALSMADRIVVIDKGRVLQIGTPQDIYDNPASVTVAKLLGQPAINIFEVESTQGVWKTKDGLVLMESDAEDGARAQLGVRPEAWLLQASGTSYGLRSQVKLVEPSGPELIVVADIGAQRVHLLLPRSHSIGESEEMDLYIDPERITLWRNDEE